MSTITSKTTTIALAGVVAAALFAAVTFSPASVLAQESREDDEIAENQHRGVFRMARGAGIATDVATGDNYRSAFQIVVQSGAGESRNDRDHEVVRGQIVVGRDGERVHYAFVPKTWQITVADDGRTFVATGAAQDKDGNQYRVALDGYFGMHTRGGNIWSLEGSLTGADIEYELHYAAITNPMATVARR
jgi:hypothetical protein